MTVEKVHFQWQNPALLETIYPLRLTNLQNALEFYEEIDLWARYKDQDPKDLPAQVQDYHKKHADIIKQAVQAYNELCGHFEHSDLNFGPPDSLAEDQIKKLIIIYQTFKTNFYKVRELNDSFRESYFITKRLEELDLARKGLDQQIAYQTRRIASMRKEGEKYPKLPEVVAQKIQAEEGVLAKLRNTQPVFEERREKLVALISAFGKREKRKKEYDKMVADAKKEEIKIQPLLAQLQPQITLLEAKLKQTQDEIARLRTPPDAEAVKKYFSIVDITDQILKVFSLSDQSFLVKVKSYHADIARLNGRDMKIVNLKAYIGFLQTERARFERIKGKEFTFKELTLQAFDWEINLMKDYKAILEYYEEQDAGVRDAAIKKLEAVKAQVLPVLRELRQKADGYEKQIAVWDDVQNIELNNYLTEYRPVAPTMKDLVRFWTAEYRDTLKNKDQYDLLDLLRQRFEKQPERFPPWLQYMIIHFAGMRYASAHGSWADPKELYMNLRIAAVGKDVKGYDDQTIEKSCYQKLLEYGRSPLAAQNLAGIAEKPHPLALATDEEWQEKVSRHLDRMGKSNIYEQRIGLQDLLTEEENYELETMTDADALAGLEALHAEGKIPPWMWKEITARTELRNKVAKDAGWEKLTAEEQQEKYNSVEDRAMVNEWKDKYLVDWRKEHEGNFQNIVSRAVCNEVAEHILHLRGHIAPPGLANAADWYVHAGEAGSKLPASELNRPYFLQAKIRDDYRPGAAILWLRYRKDPPPQWNIVNLFKTARGEVAVPPGYLGGKRWVYKDQGKYRYKPEEPGKTGQYLFWVHIATVAEVADTPDGWVVITYETNLPYDDRRRSCVGVFKRYGYNVTFDGTEDMYNGSFVGYERDNANPPKELAEALTNDLKVMLDWDRILLRK